MPTTFLSFPATSHSVGENGSKGRRSLGALVLDSGADVKGCDAVHLVAGRLSGGVPHALGRLNVQQNGLRRGRVPQLLEDRNEIVQVVTVQGADVVEPELLKESPSRHDTPGVLVNLFVEFLDVLGEEAAQALGDGAEVLERLRHEEPRGGRRQLRGRLDPPGRLRPGWQGNLTVVVQNDDHPVLQVPRRVHCLVRHAPRDGSVSNYGDAVVPSLAKHRLGDAVALNGRYGGGGVAGAKGVVLGLLHLAKAREAPQLPQRRHPVPPASQNLVRVALVSNVPNNFILGGVEDVVQSDRHLNHAEGRAEVAAGL